MIRLILALLLAVIGALAASNQTTVEILSNPSQVRVHVPELEPAIMFDNSTIVEDVVVEDVVVEDVVVDGDNQTLTASGNATAINETCIRVDYEDSGAAIFDNEVKPIDLALLIFNSSEPVGPENVLTPQDLDNLTVLNQTIVDCNEYPRPSIVDRYFGLSTGALASLAG